MNITEHMKKLAQDDIQEVIEILSDKGIEAELVGLEMSPEEIPDKIDQKVTAKLKIGQAEKVLEFVYDLDYKNGPDEITINKDCVQLAEEMFDNIHSSSDIEGTPVEATAITAADEYEDFFESDDFDESDDGMIVDDELGEDELSDTLDNISDKVDDMQDTLDSVTEDDVSIEIDNNIVNHFIAECEKCKGIFISSVVQTDVPVEHITGTCPICDKEGNQYLKWVVKEVEV